MVQSCSRSHFSNSRQYPQFTWGEGWGENREAFKQLSLLPCAAVKKTPVATLNMLTCRYSSAQLQIIVLSVLKSCPSAKLGNINPVDSCQKGWDLVQAMKGSTLLLGHVSWTLAHGERESQGDHSALILSRLVLPKLDTSRKGQRRTKAPPSAVAKSCRGGATKEVT